MFVPMPIKGNSVSLKVKVLIYSPDIPDSSADFTLYLPRYWNSLCNGLISLRRMQSFAAANAIHTFSVFVPPGTHYCWVVRGNVDSNLVHGFYT